MKLFGSVLRSHRESILLTVFCFCCCAGVFYLYGLPSEPVMYVGLICLIAELSLLLSDFFRTKRRLEGLRRLRDRVLLDAGQLPEPQSAEEAAYQEIITLLVNARTDAVGAFDRKYAEMDEYYTLWAHQIKTPIAAMRLLLQSEDTPRGREISAELTRIEQYVGMVLGYLRLNGGVNDFVIRRYPLDDIVRQAVRKFSHPFILKKIRLDYRETGFQVLTDEKWLLFVIEQLLSNAVKYTASGSVSVYGEGNGVLVIEDTGIGIAPEDLPRIFERGYTGYNGRIDQPSTGIGLYLCRRVTEKLGHTLTIESEQGKGTRVKLGLASGRLEVE